MNEQVLSYDIAVNAGKKVEAFLSNYNMHYSGIDIQKYIDLFLQEMHKGLCSDKSSLKMLPSYIKFKQEIPKNEPVIVLDAGGTNLRSALLYFDGKNKPVIENVNKSIMPGVHKEATKSEFFEAIVENSKNILDKSSRIGFVFSYPIEIYPNMDGRLIEFTKEIRASEVEGEFIGKNLIEVINSHREFKPVKNMVLLNDTVSILLSGISAFYDREYESYIGFVLGTGMNACYIEKNSNIKKLNIKGLKPDDSQLINIEAANFSKGPAGIIDMEYFKKTNAPKLDTYEKMFSGGYLGELAFEVLRHAADDGIFSSKFCKRINSISSIKSKNVDDFLFYPPKISPLASINRQISESDRTTLYFIFDSLIERAAVLSSIVLSAIIIKSGKGKNPCRPICIVAEGSSYYNMKDFQSRLYKYLQKALLERGNFFFEINRVHDAAMLGAAVAGLTT